MEGKLIRNMKTHPDLDLDTTDIYPFYRPEPSAIYKTLPQLRPHVLYVFGGTSEVSQPFSRKQKLETTGTGPGGSGGVEAGSVHEFVLDNVGHLVPMIAPKACALRSAEFLTNHLGQWIREEENFRKIWESKREK